MVDVLRSTNPALLGGAALPVYNGYDIVRRLGLGAGSVIHGLHGEQDIRNMGNVRAKMPVTFWTFGIATLAIAGIFPFAGFFSKDEILWEAWSNGNRVVWAVLTVAAGMTAFYMARLAWLTFFGKYRGDADKWDKTHECAAALPSYPVKEKSQNYEL